MGKSTSVASWIGKAAYEIMQISERNGSEANGLASDLADGLLDYGIDLTRTDPRNYARRHLGIAPSNAALDAYMGAGDVVPTRIAVCYCDEDDTIEFHIHGDNGFYADRGMSWSFAIAIAVDAYNGIGMEHRGRVIRPMNGHVIVQLPATPVRHGVTLALTRQQALDLGAACCRSFERRDTVEIGTVDARWGDEPTSPIVRARLAERQRIAA